MSVIYINSELIIHAHGTFKSLSQTNQFNDSCFKLLIYGPIILKSNRMEQMKIAIKLWPEGVNFAAMMADLFFFVTVLYCIAKKISLFHCYKHLPQLMNLSSLSLFLLVISASNLPQLSIFNRLL